MRESTPISESLREQFAGNQKRYENLLLPLGFVKSESYTTGTSAVYIHETGWRLYLFIDHAPHLATSHWNLVNPKGESVRSDEYLNDLESTLQRLIETGEFVK